MVALVGLALLAAVTASHAGGHTPPAYEPARVHALTPRQLALLVRAFRRHPAPVFPPYTPYVPPAPGPAGEGY